MGSAQSVATPAAEMATKAARDLKRPEQVVEGAQALLAWGCNKAQQCGAPTKGIILHPREVKPFRGQDLAALSAGHRHSCAVLASGAVHTWGRNSSGQLGLGIGGTDEAPQALAAFEGHPRIRGAALGYQHSLFVDISGALWGAGDNSRGQLGLGTTIQGPWSEAPAALPTMPVFMVTSELKQRMSAMGLDGGASGDVVSQHLVAPVPVMRVQADMRLADAAGSSVLHSPAYTADDHANEGTANRVAAAAIGFGDPSDLLAVRGIRYGVFPTPVRAGLALHPLLAGNASPRETRALPSDAFAVAGLLRDGPGGAGRGPKDTSPQAFVSWLQAASEEGREALGAGAGDDGATQSVSPSSDARSFEESMLAYGKGLHTEHVVKVVASKLFSAAITGSGEVWTFGVGANGELGTDNVLQTEGRRVAGPVSALVAKHGGAVDIAAGSSFALALTRNGSVIAWGRSAPQGVVLTAGGGRGGGRARLPPMVHIAAGADHALLSDGEGVWVCGGSSKGADAWSRPRRLDAPAGLQGVTKLAAGGQASALIDSDAKLWMWGRLAEAGAKGDPPVELTSGKAVMPCLNSFEKLPVPVSCLSGVTDVALGTNHVLTAASEYHSS